MLGLKLQPSPIDDPMMFEAGDGTSVVVTEIPERTPPGYPMVSFLVTGIEDLVRELKSRGVAFVEPDESSFQGQAGTVADSITDYGPVKSAHFQDSEGNVLALNEMVSLQ